ncbi:Predicted ATPase [Actinacidiphila alni]|uniref:Predicted ATPase n=1 Tax=Actinacidiphila alni TaxID=380248 RepID=A0A1I2LTE1_9ACTN|nr:BTAD domain-containing putative transcriptional regulator [Actinacidiphila alni]SFF81789.1 Predicted ATPase [Actinacidiphila alni]
MNDDGMHLRLLGRLELANGNGSVVLPGAVSRAIVGRLLLAGGAVVPRRTLIDDLWEERGAKDPVNALQVQVTKVRAALAAQGEGNRVLFRDGGYRFVLGPHDEVDTACFEAAVREGRAHLADGAHQLAADAFRRGLRLWRGRALDDVTGRVFDTERARLEDLRLSAVEEAAAAMLELGRAQEVIPELTALVAEAPLRERARSRLMLALYRCGRQGEAIEVYETGRRLLRAELGVGPSPELRALHAAILDHAPSLRVAAPTRPTAAGVPDAVRAAAERTDTAWAHAAAAGPRPEPASEVRPGTAEGNLGRALGPFVGRADDLRGLRETVGRERLVTVVGPGGVGKTRLAMEVCALAQPSYGGVWWVDLASADSASVLAAVAGALGLSDASVRPDQPPHDHLRRITSFLAGRRALLVLDNCEHLLDPAASLVAALLGPCAALTVLTTSRAPLAVAGEALYPLAPLPDDEAAELFTVRAAMIEPSFTADAADAGDIRSLCRALDGLPLAVELAAAHVRMLPVREIAARLDDRFALLTKGQRTAPARHRTLRAVLDWSYALLDAPEQRVLTELALYVGGCSVEAAEAAITLPGADGGDVLHVLARLVDKSLLTSVATPDGSRLRMLETVREYALDRLRESGGAERAEERFMAWALGFVREGTRRLTSGAQKEWAARLGAESANIRAASDLMIARSRAAMSLWLEARLGYYWAISGREEEGIDRLERSLRAYDAAAGGPAAEPTAEEERALVYTFAWLAWLKHVSGRHTEARSYIRRHEAVWHASTNPEMTVLGPCYQTLHATLNDEDDVPELVAKAEAILEGTGFHWQQSMLQGIWAAYCLQHGDLDGARRHGRNAEAAARAANGDFARAFSLTLCGDVDECDGLHEQARAQWEEAARIFRHIGARTRWAYCLLKLVCLDIGQGALPVAEERLAQVLRFADELSADDLRAAVSNLRGVLLFHRGRVPEARAVFGRVWDDTTSPPDRKAVAAIGMAVTAMADMPERTPPQESRIWADRAREVHTRLVAPLTRGAVGALLDRLDAYRASSGADRAAEAQRLYTWLASGRSVLAAFS